jgi:hypothetical protein
MPVGAIIGGAVIGAGGVVASGAMSSSAQKKAAQKASDTTLQTTQENNALAREIRSQNLQVASPFYNKGVAAGNALQELLLGPSGSAGAPGSSGGALGPTPDYRAGLPSRTDWATGALQAIGASPGADPISTLQSIHMNLNPTQQQAWANYLDSHPDPDTVYEQRQAAGQPMANPVPGSAPTASGGALDAFDRFRQGTNYQWRYNQGLNANRSQFATKGALDSGAAIKSAETYGQNIASGELSNYMNLLANQQGVGLSAGNAVMGVNTNYANNVTANNNNAASTTANAALISGQANANMWGTVGNAAGQVGGALFQYGMGQTNPATSFIPPSTGYPMSVSSSIANPQVASSVPVNWGGF